ncbi:hypothetical protein D478_14800 [Brevibacillus agri BAB-2500]|nr:hypothetical protein D478_14800 [Brevibacillus agri BAB-2500]
MKKITSTLLALSVVGMSIFSNFAVVPTTFAKSSKAYEKIPQPKFDSYKIELNDGYKIVSESVEINKNDDFIETSVYSREDFLIMTVNIKILSLRFLLSTMISRLERQRINS